MYSSVGQLTKGKPIKASVRVLHTCYYFSVDAPVVFALQQVLLEWSDISAPVWITVCLNVCRAIQHQTCYVRLYSSETQCSSHCVWTVPGFASHFTPCRVSTELRQERRGRLQQGCYHRQQVCHYQVARIGCCACRFSACLSCMIILPFCLSATLFQVLAKTAEWKQTQCCHYEQEVVLDCYTRNAYFPRL